MTEKFAESVRASLGLNLSAHELRKLFQKYRIKDSETLDKARLLKDLTLHFKRNVDEITTARHLTVLDPKTTSHDGVFKRILNLIKEIFGGRSMDITASSLLQVFDCDRDFKCTRVQLKTKIMDKLGLDISDTDILRLFQVCSQSKSDVITIGAFVDNLFMHMKKEEYLESSVAVSDVSLGAGENKISRGSFADNQSATVTYDFKFAGLIPPPRESCNSMSIQDLEHAIRDRIFERTHLGMNLAKSLIQCFGDSRNRDKCDGITKEQMRFTLWKRFQMMVSDEDIGRLFEKYDPENTGQISLVDFIEGIITNNHQNEPLITDPEVRSASTFGSAEFNRSSLPNFLRMLRLKFDELINAESRAPHYILHGTNRMTTRQARLFFERKLRVSVNPGLLNELNEHYESNGLIDMKRVLRDAMSLNLKSSDGTTLSLVDGGIVVVDKMPASMTGVSHTPDVLAEMLYYKMFERLKGGGSPLASLHHIFPPGHTRACGKAGLRSVLQKYDLIIGNEDFDNFFNRFDRGDGKIDVRSFLISIIPKENVHEIVTAPKDQSQISAQMLLSKGLGQLTGKLRQISSLQGPSHTRLHLKQDDTLCNDEVGSNKNSTSLAQEELFSDGPQYTEYIRKTFQDNGTASLSAHYPPPSLDLRKKRAFELAAKLGREIEFEAADSQKTTSPVRESVVIHSPLTGNLSQTESAIQRNNTTVTDFDLMGSRAPTSSNLYIQPTRPNTAPPSRMAGRFFLKKELKSNNVTRPDTAPIIVKSVSRRTVRRPTEPINTGQKRTKIVDPLGKLLLYKYRVSQQNTVTSSEDYGLFVKNFRKVADAHRRLRSKNQAQST